MKRVLLLILLAMAILPGKVRSQAGTVTYSGQIHNPGGDAIDYATVVLLQGDRQIAGGTTDDAGNFALKADRGIIH
ncbi:carboxypeptidase regulatory-like domain-containing protein [Parabacteroides sp. AF48-14]|uniref:carboxypeptidase regulatory-like domain-containing protein n=1 Tax=Parabacteroides sp. AF48-14 TaxID=2292052 RepID=UPI000EFF1E68|nr:carboxypeptidase regulatory-like domain-containing protein [Parabacteroides sp. AF48-14]RHO73282.1 carboxypeptidase regulatory-like domain-containing protein [Parabacteroides sp. AF48-14]